MAILVIIIILIVATFAWQFIQSRRAVATTSVLTRYTEQQVVHFIESVFQGGVKSLAWTNDRGPGRINKRRRAGTLRGVKQSITMSINITREPNGVLRVDMWASAYATYLLLWVNFAGAVVSRKKAIAKVLAEPDAEQLTQRLYGEHAAAATDQQGVGSGTPAGSPAAGDSRPSGQQQPLRQTRNQQ